MLTLVRCGSPGLITWRKDTFHVTWEGHKGLELRYYMALDRIYPLLYVDGG